MSEQDEDLGGLSGGLVTADALAVWVRQALASQPWWRKSANTVTAGVAGLVAVAWWIGATGADLPEWATYGVGVVLFVGQVVGVRMTKNGITWETERQMERAVAEAGGLDRAQADVVALYRGRHRAGDQ